MGQVTERRNQCHHIWCESLRQPLLLPGAEFPTHSGGRFTRVTFTHSSSASHGCPSPTPVPSAGSAGAQK